MRHKKMKSGFYTFIALMGCVNLNAQSIISEELKVGDSIPAKVWTLRLPVTNHPGQKEAIQLNNYKDKLIILDFWATWCGPCVASLEKLNLMQKGFKGRIRILPVTYQQKAVVEQFMKNRRWDLFSVTEDSLLQRIFPHNTVPHQVWIKEGKIKAITGPECATEVNIRSVLEGKKVRMYMKEELRNFDPSKPLLVNGNGINGDNLLYQSVITRRINTGNTGMSRRGNRITIYNADLFSLYSEAFSKNVPYSGRRNRIILEVNDSLRGRILRPDDKLTGNYEKDSVIRRWLETNTYCYNLVLPRKVPSEKMYAIIQQDLNRFFYTYFGINGSMERRKVKCLLLVRTTDKDLLKPSGKKPVNESDSIAYSLRNKPFSRFVSNLAYANWRVPLPIIDETGYEGNIDIQLNSKLKDLQGVKRELEKYGLALREGERVLDMLVIRSR